MTLLVCNFFYGKIETEIQSGLLQQTINTFNKLFITFLRSFEQKNFYCQEVMALLIFGNISYFGHNSSYKQVRNFWFSPFFMVFNSPSNHHNLKINQIYRLFWVNVANHTLHKKIRNQFRLYVCINYH